MVQLYQFSILLIFQLIFYIVAKKYNIVDRPNQRSSHHRQTVIGAGIVFPFAFFLWLSFYGLSFHYFVIGLILISITSFIDDIFNINQFFRFSVHFCACFLLLHEVGFMSGSIFVLLFSFILITGWINAYNFMDGINGMTALYSVVLFITFYLLYIQNGFIDINLIKIMLFSLVIFSWFNLRKEALMFSGDVGAISLSYIIAFIFLFFIKENNNWNYILFFSVYGVESVLTIIERIMKKENIC